MKWEAIGESLPMKDSGGHGAIGVRRWMWDTSGAFGDIGVFFPIAIVLIQKNGFNPTALFLAAGLFYIAAAYYFRITMPVQPLKAMSAIAIIAGLPVEMINAAGIVMGMILLLLSVTGLSVKLGRIFPVSVIRGIQLGLGLMLIKAASHLIQLDLPVSMMAGVILIGCIFFIKELPPLIPLLGLGAALSLSQIRLSSLGPLAWTPVIPEATDLWVGFTTLVLPQIALTLGNAVVATEATGKMLYGKTAERLNLRSIPLSMGIANVISGWMGGVPMCHGSGGMTAHFKLGATSRRSAYIIGATFIGLALLFGGAAFSIISSFPKGVLGVLLFYVGTQHALLVSDILRMKPDMLIAITVGLVGLVSNNLTVGFLVGIGIHYGFAGRRKRSKCVDRRRL